MMKDHNPWSSSAPVVSDLGMETSVKAAAEQRVIEADQRLNKHR